jgi:hypothetical protein
METITLYGAIRPDDGMVIFTKEGTPLQNIPLRRELLRRQLEASGATQEQCDDFEHRLDAAQWAEIEVPKRRISLSGRPL